VPLGLLLAFSLCDHGHDEGQGPPGVLPQGPRTEAQEGPRPRRRPGLGGWTSRPSLTRASPVRSSSSTAPTWNFRKRRRRLRRSCRRARSDWSRSTSGQDFVGDLGVEPAGSLDPRCSLGFFSVQPEVFYDAWHQASENM